MKKGAEPTELLLNPPNLIKHYCILNNGHKQIKRILTYYGLVTLIPVRTTISK